MCRYTNVKYNNCSRGLLYRYRFFLNILMEFSERNTFAGSDGGQFNPQRNDMLNSGQLVGCYIHKPDVAPLASLL